jgi:hypothetical protein
VDTKTCTKCGGTFPLTDFYLNKKTGKPSSACKKCHTAGVVASQKKRKERANESAAIA